MTPITQLLEAAHHGGRRRSCCRSSMTFLRLVGDQQFHGRGHFFAAAAEEIQRILVEQSERRLAAEHERATSSTRMR